MRPIFGRLLFARRPALAWFLLTGIGFVVILRPALASETSAVPITALAFTPDGQALVSNGPRRVDIRSAKDGSVQGSIPCELQKITSLAFPPRGELMAVAGGEAGMNGEIRLLDWKARTIRQRFTNAHDLITSAAFSADGTFLGAGCFDHHARVWRRSEANAPFTQAFTLSGHAGPVLAIAFSPTGRTIVTASADRSIKVWSTDDGRLLRTFGHHLEAVNALTFRPVPADQAKAAACFCASGSDDRTLRVWQPEIGRMVRIVRQHRAPIFAVVHAADGRSLFSAGKEGIIRRFEAESDELLSEWPTHTDWIYSLAISPDGKKLASGDWAGNVRVREIPELKPSL